MCDMIILNQVLEGSIRKWEPSSLMMVLEPQIVIIYLFKELDYHLLIIVSTSCSFYLFGEIVDGCEDI